MFFFFFFSFGSDRELQRSKLREKTWREVFELFVCLIWLCHILRDSVCEFDLKGQIERLMFAHLTANRKRPRLFFQSNRKLNLKNVFIVLDLRSKDAVCEFAFIVFGFAFERCCL